MRWAGVIVTVAVMACAPSPPPDPFADISVDARTVELYGRTCAVCHGPGHGGAPRMGDVDAWAARVEQGDEVLLAHTIDGFANMPPLGMCMDCERNDLKSLIRLMAVPGAAP
jgi:cytochrome c5